MLVKKLAMQRTLSLKFFFSCGILFFLESKLKKSLAFDLSVIQTFNNKSTGLTSYSFKHFFTEFMARFHSSFLSICLRCYSR